MNGWMDQLRLAGAVSALTGPSVAKPRGKVVTSERAGFVLEQVQPVTSWAGSQQRKTPTITETESDRSDSGERTRRKEKSDHSSISVSSHF